MSPKFDFHFHSFASDGVLSPRALMQRAADQQIDYVALTDHDSIEGLPEARQAAAELNLTLISGVELTTVWNGVEIHIVGLNFDVSNAALKAFNIAQLQRRRKRAEAIDQKLAKNGIHGVLEYVDQQAQGQFVGRLLFAKALVALGHVKNNEQAFKKYLSHGKPAYAKVDWPSIDEAISVIKNAGGIPVLAHPLRYKMTNSKLRKLCAEFKAHGGEGIEVVRAGEGPENRLFASELAAANKLLASGGSDFHAPAGSWSELGKFAPLPDHLPNVLDKILLDLAR